MAKHDREDPHLEDQLAWLDAIKEMPDGVEIAVSAVTSATLASPPPSPEGAGQGAERNAGQETGQAAAQDTGTDTGQPQHTERPGEPENASPYPSDPWRLASPDPQSGPLPGRLLSAPLSTSAPEGGAFGGAGAFGQGSPSPADTDSYSWGGLGAFADPGTRDTGEQPKPWDAPETVSVSSSALSAAPPADAAPADTAASPESTESAHSPDASSGKTEQLRGWLEPAVPVDPSSKDRPSFGQLSAPTSSGPTSPESTASFPGFPTFSAFSAAAPTSRPEAPERDDDSREGAAPHEGASPFPSAPGEPTSPLDGKPLFGTGEHGTVDFGSRDSSTRDLGTGEFGTKDFGEFGGGEFREPAAERDAGEATQAFAVKSPREQMFGFGAPAGVESAQQDRAAEAEAEPYQARHSPPAPPPPAPTSNHPFGGGPARGTGTGKPNADSLDPVTLLRGRRNVPASGWRRLVYLASAGLIKPGDPPEVRRRRELVNRARTPVVGGHHRVAVLSLKGGVGKTTTTVGLGATLAQVRGDRVIAVDANPDRGTLSDKVELETSATVRDLLNERGQIKRYVDIRAFTSQTPARLEILASDRDPSVSEAFSAEDYQAVAQVLENFYSICITDCGTGLLHSAMSGVLGMADQIVLVSSPSVDGARAASATLDWLEAHNYGDLVRAATVVLCSVRPRSKSKVDLDKLEAHFAARCRSVVRVPYDPHLEEGAEIDLDRLQEATRDAYLRLAASVGAGFAGPQALAQRRFSEIPDHL